MTMTRLFAAAFLLLIFAIAHAADATVGGEITLLKGRATVTQGAQTLRLYQGASVLVGDRLHTGPGGRLRLHMIDGTDVTLGENTEFIVHEYEFHGDTGIGVLELTKGFFRAVTGKITKLGNNNFKVKTPLAVIGVRGTDFWGEQNAQRLRIALLGGTAIIVSNDAGEVEITESGFGTEVAGPGQAPKPPYRWSPDALTRAAGTVN